MRFSCVASLVAASAAASAAAAAAAADASAGNPVCFPPPYDPATCLSWRADATNITFTAVWPPVPGSTSAIGWGGWGISSLTCGSMYPSSVWMAIRGPGGVVLEDRAAVGHVVPQCRKEQLSYVTAKHIGPDGTVTISWTRPLIAPKASGQPTIVPGNVSIIGAAFYGDLDLRPCEPSGIPGHFSAATFTVELLPGAGHGSAAGGDAGSANAAASPAAPATGLIAALPVCTSYTNLARLTPAGLEQFYGVSTNSYLLPGITALDAVGRRLYSLTLSAAGGTYDLLSINVDTGARGATCATTIPVPSNYALQDLNLAFDQNNKTVIVAACTDTECAGYVQVSRVDPASCALTPVVKVPTDPPIAPAQSAAAFDPATNTFVMTISQAVGKNPASPVLVSVNMLTGKVAHVLAETDTRVVALSSAGPGLFLGVSVRTADASIALATFDSARNKVSRGPVVPNCVEALPGLSALVQNANGDVLYFITQDGVSGSPRIIGLFGANGTIASTGLLPGDASQTPSAFFAL